MTILRRQLERTDLNLTLEMGRRVERAIHDENRRNAMVPLHDRLKARVMQGKRRVAAWTYEKQRFEAAVLRDIRSLIPVHDLDCPCDGCTVDDWERVP